MTTKKRAKSRSPRPAGEKRFTQDLVKEMVRGKAGNLPMGPRQLVDAAKKIAAEVFKKQSKK